MSDQPNALDWAAAFGPILKEEFPNSSSLHRMAAAHELAAAVMARQSWMPLPPPPPTTGDKTDV